MNHLRSARTKLPALVLCLILAAATALTAGPVDAVVSAAGRMAQRLIGTPQIHALRDLLRSAAAGGLSLDPLFPHEAQLRRPLRALILSNDPSDREQAASLLALFGDPADLRFILRHQVIPPGEHTEEAVVSALLDPRTETDWDLLRQAALRGSHHAIRTLKLISSPRGLRILEEVHTRFLNQPEQPVRDAIHYAQSRNRSNHPLAGPTLDALTTRISEALRAGDLEIEAGPPLFNRTGDRALIRIRSVGPCVFTYSATAQRLGGLWRLRSLRFRSASLTIPDGPSSLAATPLIPPPPDLSLAR